MKMNSDSATGRSASLRIDAAAHAAGRGEQRVHPHNGTRQIIGGMLTLALRILRQRGPKVPTAGQFASPPGTNPTAALPGVTASLPGSSGQPGRNGKAGQWEAEGKPKGSGPEAKGKPKGSEVALTALNSRRKPRSLKHGEVYYAATSTGGLRHG